MRTVLVVEDSRTQRQMMTDVLQAHAFEVLAAEDGVEALERIQTTRPDLVVLDVVMPRLNGYEVCRRLKADPATRQVPIIFCSSSATEVDRYWGFKQGATAYISKPFHPQDLVNTVQKVLRS